MHWKTSSLRISFRNKCVYIYNNIIHISNFTDVGQGFPHINEGRGFANLESEPDKTW